MAAINQNLPALLAQAHVSDPVVAARITAGVNLILTTVQSFAALHAGDGQHFAAGGGAEAGDSEGQRFEKAVESAGVRAYGKAGAGCGFGGVCAAVDQETSPWVLPLGVRRKTPNSAASG